jgi:NitT/TauT family transport system permease protein
MSELQPLRFRGAGFDPGRKRGAAAVAAVLLVGIWQGLDWAGFSDPILLPSPIAIGHAFAALVAGDLWLHLAASLQRLVLGWCIGTTVGLTLGLAMGIFTMARSVGAPLISALFPIPKIALLPLLILWMGIGEAPKVATIALGVFFPTAIAAASGVDAVPRNLIRMAQSFNLPWRRIVREVVLPGAMPGIVAGFRISASIALILLVAAEMIGAEYGLGAMINEAGHLMRTDRLLAGVLMLSLLGLSIGTTIGVVERRMLRWR